MANDDKQGPDSLVMHYLRSIDAKLDRLNKQLDDFLSAPKTKRKRAARRPIIWARTPEEAEELWKNNPDAEIIVTGVPGADNSFVQ